VTSDYNLTVATIWPNESGQRGWRGVINRAKWSERDEIYDVEWRQNHIVAVSDKSSGRQQKQAQRRRTNRESEHHRFRFRAPFFGRCCCRCGKLGRGEFERRTDLEASSTFRWVWSASSGVFVIPLIGFFYFPISAVISNELWLVVFRYACLLAFSVRFPSLLSGWRSGLLVCVVPLSHLGHCWTILAGAHPWTALFSF